MSNIGRSAFLLATATAFVAVAGGARDASAQEARLTMEQAIDLALRHSPVMVQREGSIRTAEWGSRVAYGNFLPSLSLSSSGSRRSSDRFDPATQQFISDGSNSSYSAGLNTSVDIFTAGRRGAQLNRAQAEITSAESALTEQQFNVKLSVQRAFYNVLRAEETMRLAETRIRRAEQGLESAERHMEVGSGTQSDVLRARLELNNARQALAEAEQQHRVASFGLGRLTGHDGPVGARLDQPLEPRPLALSHAELEALVARSSPSVAAAEASVRSADAALRVSRTQYAPTLRASGGYNWANQDLAFSDGRTSWSMSLGLSYPLFNGFQREASYEQARVQTQVARAQASDAQRAARAEFNRVYSALELAHRQIELAEEAVAVATEDLRMQQERYRLGVSTILDQITSQINLIQSEMNLVAARYDYQIARAEIEALVGREL